MRLFVRFLGYARNDKKRQVPSNDGKNVCYYRDMPELPEVETIKRQLSKALVGKKVIKVEVRGGKTFVGEAEEIVGKSVVEIERRGKALAIAVGGEKKEWGLLIHLKMTGQLIYESKGERIAGGHPTGDFVSQLPSSHTRVVFDFEDGSRLFFNDQRMFGWIKLMKWESIDKEPFVMKLGKEPWDISEEEFGKILQSRKPVKVRLMDQDVIAGVGNIYANDALWEARVDPRRSSNSLSRKESDLLLQCVRMVLDEGIKYGGATAMDGKYVDLQGMGGTYQEHFRTYQREGEKCLREDCDGVIEKVTLGGRGTFFCKLCQR